MSWSESDISFKKLNNKRITTNLGKGLAEERGASAIELYAGDLKTDTIPGTPPVSSTSVVNVYDFAGKLQLVPDYSVPDNMTWFATTIIGNDVTANDGSLGSESARLKDWISDKYDAPGTVPGAGYEIKVYDASNNLITKSDPSQWFFDYQTGILMFKNPSTIYGSVSTTGPFSIVGYRYIGAKGIGSGSGSVTNIATSGGIQGGPITTTGTLSLDLTYSPEWVGTHTFLKNAITSNYVNAINLSNKTASSSGSSNQYSPSLEWIGNVWNTSSSTGNTARFSTRLETTQGTTPTGQLVFKSTVDTGTASWTDRLIISSSGRVEIPGTLKLNVYDGALFASSGVVSNGTLPVIYGGLGYSSFTKGDILVGAGTTIIKLGVGSASQILTVDSSTAAGVKWSDASSVGAGLSSLNGLTSLNQYFAVGYSGSQFNIVSSGSTHTFNIPIAGVGVTGLITGIGQTIAGSKTFQDDLYASANILLTGAITSGSWAGNAITGLYGGTGFSNYTKGDILVGAGSTFIKLNVGTNNYVLTASSSSATGLTWSPTAATGITTLNSLTSTSQTFEIGAAGTVFNISSIGSSHTFNIPIAGVGVTGLVTGIAQTFGGAKTFQDGIVGDLTGTASTSNYAIQAGYALTTGTATTTSNINVVNSSSNSSHPLLFTPSSGTLSGAAVSSNSTVSYNPSSAVLSTPGLAVTASTASTSFSTGALVVTGGVGIGGSLFVNGDLTINGTTTTINSVTLTVDDKNIEIGSVGSPTDVTAEAGGITLKGTTDKFINWYSGTGWSSNQDWNLANGLSYKINNTSVLSSTSLGIGITNSYLTSVGTITSGTWAGSLITGLYGGTGYSSYNKGDLLVGAGSTFVKLPVGTDTYVLTSNSSTTAGVAWTAASSIGSSTIGTPTDGTYTDGFYNTWTSATTIADAVDNLNQLLGLIAPAKPGYLTGTALSAVTVPTYYTVGISAGLGTEWYQAGYGTNSSITKYYISASTITLNTANQSSIFSAGSLTTSTYGTIYFKRYNSSSPSGAGYGTIDLTTNYAVGYTNNNLKLTGLATSNSIWTKANAQILTYTQSTPGYEGYTIAHTENSQESNRYEVWKDPWTQSNPNPIHSQAATASTYSQAIKYLSGIGYYTTGTGLSVYFKGAAGIFSCCYNTTQIYAISATGLTTATGTTSSPLYSGELDKTGSNHVRVSLNSSSASSFNKYVTVTLYKAGGGTSASNATLSRAINTYGTVSTTTYEGFQDEAQRLVIGSGIAFTSNIDMANGNAQVRSGTLQYPLASDYDTEYGGSHSFTGDQEYQRYFYKTSASTGTLTFTGFAATNIAAYGTGNMNVLAYLESDSKWFDLGVLQGSNGNDGSTRSLAIAAKTSASGGALNWSFGVYSTGVSGAGNSGRYRVVVIFRNNTYSMTSITSS
jgi:hypothetical protein